MKKIKNRAVKPDVHEDANCFGLIVLCQKVNQGWILDRYHRKKAFTMEQLTSGLNGVHTLQGKPKFIIVQEAREGK